MAEDPGRAPVASCVGGSATRQRAVEASHRELVAWLCDDLRLPLARIRALVEVLEDGVVDDPEAIARYHRMLRQEADRLALLVDDLMELGQGVVDARDADRAVSNDRVVSSDLAESLQE